MTKKLKSGTPFVYDENDRVVGIRDPHTGTDTDLVTAVTHDVIPNGLQAIFRNWERHSRRHSVHTITASD